jgi:hypothetical protein
MRKKAKISVLMEHTKNKMMLKTEIKIIGEEMVS